MAQRADDIRRRPSYAIETGEMRAAMMQLLEHLHAIGADLIHQPAVVGDDPVIEAADRAHA